MTMHTPRHPLQGRIDWLVREIKLADSLIGRENKYLKKHPHHEGAKKDLATWKKLHAEYTLELEQCQAELQQECELTSSPCTAPEPAPSPNPFTTWAK